MSLVFINDAELQQKAGPNKACVQRLLDENSQLISTILEYQNIGRLQECLPLQETLQRNLLYLAALSDGTSALVAELKTIREAGSDGNQLQPLQSTENIESSQKDNTDNNQLSNRTVVGPPTRDHP